MSAKQAYRKPTLHIEKLPDDVLCEVFRHATWVPYGIDPSDLAPDAIRSSQWRELLKAHRASIVTKRCLVRVCKSWYSLTALYFYEWITLWKLKHLRTTISSIERPLPGNTYLTEKPTFGWGTKRLDIILQDYFHYPAYDVEGLLLHLLYALPRLEVIIVHNNCAASLLIHSMSKPICPDLQIMKWDHGITLKRNIWHVFVSNHPQLVAINPILPSTERTPTGSSTNQTHGLVPHSNIKFYSTQYLDAPLSIPYTSLEYLTLSFHELPATKHVEWLSWIPSYFQQNLRTLQLNTHATSWRSFSQLFCQFSPYWRLAPNLHCIKIALGYWPFFDCDWGIMPIIPSSVKYFSICAFVHQPKKSDLVTLLRYLSELVQENKGLVVQFSDRKLAKKVDEHRDYLGRLYVDHQKDILLSWLDPDGNEVGLLDDTLIAQVDAREI